MRDDKSADSWTGNRTDLKNAVVPGNGIGEGVARHQTREK